MVEFFIGIDPGVSGGLACLRHGTYCTAMPKTEKDIWDWFYQYSTGEAFAVIEKVGGFIGGKGQPGSAMFKFGRNTGILIGCLTAAGIPYEEITPQRWQKALGVSTRKHNESKGQFKNRLKAKAQQLFPDVKIITLATCDALLIAEYCRRKQQGKL